MDMNDDDRVFVPSYPYEAGPARGVLSPFEPGTRTLPAGYRIDPRFRPITTVMMNGCRPGPRSDPRYDWPSVPCI